MSNEPESEQTSTLRATLSRKWKVSAGRISQLIALGMPTESLEAAEAWRTERAANTTRGGRPRSQDSGETFAVSPEDVAGAESTTLEESLREHRRLSAIAQRRWALAQESNAPEEQRLYKIYQESKNGEMKIEKAVLDAKVRARELVVFKEVFADFAKVLSEIRNAVRNMGIEIAPAANPDDPGRALKVIDEKANKLLRQWSRIEPDALERIQESEPAAPAPLDIPEEGEE